MNDGYVYFIESEGSGQVKIGWAKHSPSERMATLQTGCPELLIMRGYFRGTMDSERRMHRTFRELRVRGEWFCNILKLSDFLSMLELFDSAKPVGERELAECLAEAVRADRWHDGIGVSQGIYDESGDWQPWEHLLRKYGLLEYA